MTPAGNLTSKKKKLTKTMQEYKLIAHIYSDYTPNEIGSCLE